MYLTLSNDKLKTKYWTILQVRKWSKSIDLFSKDYIIVPINEHQHWYLAIICYPWLEAPHYEDNKTWTPANKRSERGDQDDTVDEKDIDGVLSKVTMETHLLDN